MTFTVVKKLPKSRAKNNLYLFLGNFMSTGSKFAKVDFASMDYCSMESAQNSIREAARRYKYPIKVRMINGEIYLIRTDK